MDKICTIGLITLIFIFCAKDSYTPPSMSVQYYLGYDYLRHFYEQGSYRPDLPILDPGGTWLNMLTYNPALFSISTLWSSDISFESYSQTMGIIHGLFQAGFISILGLTSATISGRYTTGTIVASTLLVPINGQSLLFTILRDASHDTPILYLPVLCCFLAYIATFTFKRAGQEENKEKNSLTLLVIFLSIFSISVRPYLIGLLIIIAYTSLKWIAYVYAKRKTLKKITKQFSFQFMAATTVAVFAGSWQILLFSKYNKFTTYSHREQFANVGDIKHSAIDIATSSMSGIEASNLILYNPIAAILGLTVICTLLKRYKNRINSKAEWDENSSTSKYTLIKDWLLLGTVIILATYLLPQTQLHWKSYILPIIILYAFCPVMILSLEAKNKHVTEEGYKGLYKKQFPHNLVLILYAINSLAMCFSTAEAIANSKSELLENDNRARQSI